MPYQPTNPYPYNTGIDLREGLTLQFRVDNYDTIIKFEIEIYDLFKNEKIYTIIREIGEIDNIAEEKVLIEGDKQIIRIFDETDTLVYFNYYEGDSVLPVVGGLSEESVCKIELTNYLKTIEQIQNEKYYNGVTDFTNFQITEINDPDNPNLSYYILDKDDNDNYYISGINPEYKEYFEELTTIVVPYQVQEELVRGIGTNVFSELSSLQEVILPSSIYAIGEQAFYNCENLTNVTFSYGLAEIGKEAFSNCVNLTSVKMLDSITTLGEACFKGCENLTSLVLSNSLEEVPDECFYGNSSLKNINFKNVKTIGNSAFEDCSKVSEIKFSDNLISIGQSAFKNCKSIYEVNLPISLETIEQGAFNGCENIVIFILPFIGKQKDSTGKEGVFGYIFGEVVDGGILQKCSDTEEYYFAIPSSIARVEILDETIISYGAFYNCEEIIEIILNEGVTEIGEYAFYNCYNLTSIEIPSTVTFIGNNAFSLQEVSE